MADIKPLVITFNCGRELVKPSIFSSHIVSTFPQISPELIVIALEEVAPVAYSFLAGSFLSSYLDRFNQTVDLTARKWGDHTYENVLTRNLGMTALMVFARSDFKDSIAQVEVGGVGVGYQEMGNKGAVAARLGMRNGDGELVELTFVAAHLAPAENALEKRNDDWKQIVRGLTLSAAVMRKEKTEASPSERSAVQDEQEPLLAEQREPSSKGSHRSLYSSSIRSDSRSASHLIVAGDLNYRTSDTPPRPYARAGFPQLSADPGSPHHHSNLLPSDQLAKELASKRTLHGLVEAEITFAPTYKYSNNARRQTATLEDGDLKPGPRRDENVDTGRDLPTAPLDFPWAGHRWPSWCDRILWMSAEEGGEDLIKPIQYTSLKLMSSSDHQPVALHLSIPFRPVPISEESQQRRRSPFDLDHNCAARRSVARRKEIAVGVVALIVTTNEGRAVLAALLVGALGGWAIMSRLLV